MRDLPHARLTRMAQTKKVLHIADLTKDRSYVEREARIVALVEAAGARTIVAVPMLKEDELVGGLALYRREVRPFTNKQIELVKNFASQAVIAIENARLLNELRQSLEQQTATADVLKVISRSTFDLQTVLQTLVQSTAHLCQADKATITRQKGRVVLSCGSLRFFRRILGLRKKYSGHAGTRLSPGTRPARRQSGSYCRRAS
jgi:two-component system, NtrC family, sensor kinase